jgi:hypothetical protein
MKPSNTIPWTYPSPAREAIRKIHPAFCPIPVRNAPRWGPGSGSLGEFIENRFQGFINYGSGLVPRSPEIRKFHVQTLNQFDSERSVKLLGE